MYSILFLDKSKDLPWKLTDKIEGGKGPGVRYEAEFVHYVVISYFLFFVCSFFSTFSSRLYVIDMNEYIVFWHYSCIKIKEGKKQACCFTWNILIYSDNPDVVTRVAC